MPTLLEVRNRIADQLSRSNLSTQIDAEIGLAIQRYSRKVSWLTEVRGATLDTVASQTWYLSIDLTSGAGPQSVAGRTSVSLKDVQRINYIRDDDDLEMRQLHYKDFERLFDADNSLGGPTHFALYGGQLGFWPTPDAAVEFQLSVTVKPVVPTMTTDTSVFFDYAQELIENAAAGAVCRKFIQDTERAAAFQAYEAAAWNEIVAEGRLKMGTGKIVVHD